MSPQRANPTAIFHTHGFKAYVVGRIAKSLGARPTGVVSTSHGFDNSGARLRAYKALDRMSNTARDVVTMPAEAMLTRFLRGANGKFVPNAIPDQPVPTEDAQLCARQRFGWAETDYVAGATGRLSAEAYEDLCSDVCARHGSAETSIS